tara:strand:+ start:2603 stop:3085 length:483 start_codon:yes stop_codon:yes gene_type:complete
MRTYNKLNKILFFVLTSYFLLSCGYQPILNKENQKFTISEFILEGNKRLGGLLKNNLITSKKEENKLVLTIKSSKKTSIANKSQTGKILTYAVTINFDITATNNADNKIMFSRVYTQKQNYGASDVYLDTINSEKEVIKTIIESVANKMQIGLNSIYQEK